MYKRRNVKKLGVTKRKTNWILHVGKWKRWHKCESALTTTVEDESIFMRNYSNPLKPRWIEKRLLANRTWSMGTTFEMNCTFQLLWAMFTFKKEQYVENIYKNLDALYCCWIIYIVCLKPKRQNLLVFISLIVFLNIINESILGSFKWWNLKLIY